MPRRRPVLALFLVALAGVGYLGWRLGSRGSAQRNPTLLLASGTVEATEVVVRAEIMGRIQELLVEEGDRVEAGQVVALLGREELEAQVEQARGALAAAEARWRILQAGTREEQIRQAEAQWRQAEAAWRGAQRQYENARLAYERSTELKLRLESAEQEHEAAQAAYRQAQAHLEALRNGPRPQEVEQARAVLRQAEAALEGAQKALANAQQSYEQRTALRWQVDQAQAQYEMALAQLHMAQARLDMVRQGPRPEQIERARAEVKRLEAARDHARQSLERTRRLYAEGALPRQRLDDAQMASDSAEAALKAAQAALEELEAGSRSEEIRQAEAGLEHAQAAVEGARRALRDAQQLYEEALEAKQRLDAAEAQLRIALAQRDAAKQQLDLLLEGTRPETLRQAEALVEQARAQRERARRTLENLRQLYADRLEAKIQLDSARTQLEAASAQRQAAKAYLDLLRAGARREEVEAAQGEVERARGALKAAQSHLEKTILRSPLRGIVTEKNAEAGEMVAVGTPIVTLANLEDLWATVYVPLSFLGRVRLGQEVEVACDTFPDKRYRGRVVHIAQEPEFTPQQIQTAEERVKLVFAVKVAIENPRGELKPGMPVDAWIRVGP